MFTIEHDFDATVITLVDEGRAPLAEDVTVTAFEDCVTIEQLDDPYQIPRVLSALLDAPRLGTPTFGLVERVMSTELLAPQ